MESKQTQQQADADAKAAVAPHMDDTVENCVPSDESNDGVENAAFCPDRNPNFIDLSNNSHLVENNAVHGIRGEVVVVVDDRGDDGHAHEDHDHHVAA